MTWVAIVLLLLVVSILETSLGGPWLGGRIALDLSAAVVAYVALFRGARAGAVAGFMAGILSDLAEPSALGKSALVLTLAGYIAGALGEKMMRASILTQFTLLGVTVFARQAVVLALSPSAGWRHGATALAFYAVPAAMVTSLVGVAFYQIISRLTKVKSR
jgi:rod shape-determining protein MreD